MLSDRFTQALILATELHATQVRKGTSTPYISHLLGVSSLVLEHGGDEDEAISALLHDAVEDQGGAATLERIRGQFGDRVAAIVEACTDTQQTPKPLWKERKEIYLKHLHHASVSACLVSAADKLHNARAILADLHTHGNSLWTRFSGGRDGVLWYYRSLVDILQSRSSNPLMTELNRTVTAIETLAGQLLQPHQV
jgi:(p)ppGpp synthase/HD superfamily hydrolase